MYQLSRPLRGFEKDAGEVVVLVYKHKNMYSALLISNHYADEKLVFVIVHDIWGFTDVLEEQ